MTTQSQALVLVNQAMELHRKSPDKKEAKQQTVTATQRNIERKEPLGFYKEQLHIGVNKFTSAIDVMSWGIVDDIINKVFEQELARYTDCVKRLHSKVGIWSNGGRTYRSAGKGNKEHYYVLINVTTGRKINVSLSTIVSKWKYAL